MYSRIKLQCLDQTTNSKVCCKIVSFYFSSFPSKSEIFWSRRFRKAIRQTKHRVSQIDPNAPNVSARDSDSTVLFDPSKLAIVHAAETPEHSNLPAATVTEDHLVSLSHSILDTDDGSESTFLYVFREACATYSARARVASTLKCTQLTIEL